MILVCPLCQTRFLVQAHVFATSARAVRCARCQHTWNAELPQGVELPAILGKPLPPPPSPIPESIPEQSAPVIRPTPDIPPTPLEMLWNRLCWPLAILLIGGTLLWLILDRQDIGHRWPSMEPFYEAIHMPVYYPGDDLEFEDVRSELKFDGGINKLNLVGKIKNKTKKSQKVPNIIAEAIGGDGRVIQSWQIDAPKATLAPEEEVPFSSSINAPKGTVMNMNLNFIEKKDDE